MSVMMKLSAAIRNSRVDLGADVDLPFELGNIYACSVYRFDDSHPVHTFVAGPHTAVVMERLSDWCEMRHDFRPLRSTAKTPVRRLKMLDLIENPGAWDAALQNAKALGNLDTVALLRRIPQWISAQTGVPIPEFQMNLDAPGLVAALAPNLTRTVRA
ncbi:portal protein [Pseudomonas phage PMBT3]|uniref:Portal protein n=1 Tax=Pseudomonas phage PMBT3 TaxID=2059856 RepID=A0A2I6PI14_9CAUD|nr:portal protein [Pseudomonas phage PMBT3]AUM59710.1 portal protein [Pseudomonas phage PMBT3]